MQSIDKQQMNILVELQQIEIRQQELRKSLEAVPHKTEALDQRFSVQQDGLQDAEARQAELQKRYRSHEADVAENTDKIKKRKARLNSLKTNKEYQTTLKEMDELAQKNSCIEDDMLAILDQIESVEKELVRMREAVLELQQEIDAEKMEIAAEAAQWERELAALDEKWCQVAQHADAKLLDLFQTVKSKTGIIAMARAKNSVCLGCNMNIPPQLYNELQREDSLHYCPFCQRLLYFKSAEEAAAD